VNVIVNGAPSEVPIGATVADVVDGLGHSGSSQKGIAVALNGEVIVRSRWSETRVEERDRIEILAAIQGG
jgi:sulfur carrier protein